MPRAREVAACACTCHLFTFAAANTFIPADDEKFGIATNDASSTAEAAASTLDGSLPPEIVRHSRSASSSASLIQQSQRSSRRASDEGTAYVDPFTAFFGTSATDVGASNDNVDASNWVPDDKLFVSPQFNASAVTEQSAVASQGEKGLSRSGVKSKASTQVEKLRSALQAGFDFVQKQIMKGENFDAALSNVFDTCTQLMEQFSENEDVDELTINVLQHTAALYHLHDQEKVFAIQFAALVKTAERTGNKLKKIFSHRLLNLINVNL